MVCMKDLFPPGKGGYQHQQRALRQVEVGDQPVYDLESIAGINVNSRLPGVRLEDAVFPCYALQSAAGGGPHGDHPPAGSPAVVDLTGAFLRYGDVFCVHRVVLDVLLLHRSEGSQSHVEQHGHNGRTLGAQPVQ